ncbi:MAG TPA: nuclear transport factor 2 family protein [Xanthomonadaceae bacterium]|nr:nuclear transport factor 2 family protein [Xanthomonadaceae bacterium]
MKSKSIWRLCGMLALLAVLAPVHAQSWSPEQTAVWKAVAATWEKDLQKDGSWIEDDTHDAVSAWGMDYPAPRGKSSISRWNKHQQSVGSMVMYDLAPHAIAVVGDTALAHYHYSVASKNAEGKNDTTHGRCSDTMVRQGGRWVFLGWSCSDEPKHGD